METNNDSPNPIREDDWDEAAEENYPQELTEVLQAADVAEQLEQAQEEEYTPDWDGTDAEFVEDEDAAEYEEQYAGIKLSYTLNREEAMACLKRAHIYKTCLLYTSDDIRSSKRSANISNARQIAVYVVREITQLSMTTIGEEFGGRDHSTVVYAVQQVEKNMKKDSKTKAMVEDIIKNIRDR